MKTNQTVFMDGHNVKDIMFEIKKILSGKIFCVVVTNLFGDYVPNVKASQKLKNIEVIGDVATMASEIKIVTMEGEIFVMKFHPAFNHPVLTFREDQIEIRNFNKEALGQADNFLIFTIQK